MQRSAPAQVETAGGQAAQPQQETTAQAAPVHQIVSAEASMQHAAAAGQAAMPSSVPDRTQELLQQVLAQLPGTAASDADALPGPVSADQSQLLARQAAELASARQAMQLMLQLLQDRGLPAESAGETATGRPSDSDVRELLSRLLQRQPADGAATQDRNEVIAAQAAELASARQAMQLLAQLLEQETVEVQVSQAAAQAADQPASQDDASHRGDATELRLQQALEGMLQQLPGSLASQVRHLDSYVPADEPIAAQPIHRGSKTSYMPCLALHLMALRLDNLFMQANCL